MEKFKKKLSRKDIQSLKECLRQRSHDNPLILLFRLTKQFTEVEQISKTVLSDEGSQFFLYKTNKTDLLSVGNDKEFELPMSETFLKQITRFICKANKKQPPDSIALMVDTRYLKISENKDLFQHGRIIRSWIDSIRTITFRNIPVVLLIRNAEDLEGFDEWAENLEEHYLDEAFGFASPDEEIDAQSLVTEAFREINNQFSNHVFSEKSPELTNKRFVNSLTAIKQNLSSLINGIIQTQPDLTPPKFIGFYFIGMVNRSIPMIDETATDLLSETEPTDNRPSEISIQAPAFVNDLCENILINAGSYVQAYRPESGRGGLYKTVSMSIILFIIAACGLMFMAYNTHMDTLKYIINNISTLQKNITTPQDAIPYFNSLKNNIIILENEIDGWWLPWMGFSKEINSLRQMKQKYVSTFRKYLLKPLIDRYMLDIRNHMSKRSTVEISDQNFHQKTGQYMSTLAFYVENLSRFFSTVEDSPFIFAPKDYSSGKEIFEQPLSYEGMDNFLACYDQALRWTDYQREFRKDFHLFQTTIQEMVVMMPTVIEWIIPIVNKNLPGIQLASLWNIKESKSIPDAEIPAAFTQHGYQFIHHFFSVIRKAHSQPGPFDERLQVFHKNYQKDFIHQWETSAKHFLLISDYLDGRDNWADIMSSLADVKKNPFFQMIRIIVDNTQQFSDQKKNWPQWLDYSQRLYEMTIIENSGTTDSISKTTQPSNFAHKTNEINTIFKEYLKALKEISTFPNTPERSYALIETIFKTPGQFCPGDGPETIACLSIFQLQSMWDKKNEQNAAFWELYEGPMDFIRKFSMNETACQLQHHWDEKILSASAQGNQGDLAIQQKSNALEFVRTVGQPFLEKITSTRFVPKRVSGMMIPFKESFFHYVAYHPGTNPQLKDQYPVIIKATPSRTNTNAEYLPQLTMIKMKCEGNQQILVIGHQPSQETFNWSESCGPVHIIFHLKEMKLTRSYPNPMAFPKFIRDVRYGSKRFHRSDFVLQNARLASMGIEYIELRLQLFGHEPLLNAQKKGFLAPPEQITYCWEGNHNNLHKSEPEDEPIENADPEKKGENSEKPAINKIIKQSDEPKVQSITQEKQKINPEEDVYILILASFRNETNAVKKAHYLTKEGLNSKVYWLKDNNDNPWYIVVSGIFTDQEKANETINEIRKKYNISPFMKKMKKNIIDDRQVQMNF